MKWGRDVTSIRPRDRAELFEENARWARTYHSLPSMQARTAADMAEFPAFPLWTDAYIADCSHLSDAEHGVYLQLLILLWRSPQQRIPNDPEWIARKFRRSVDEAHATVMPVVREFCTSDGNWITQKRLSKEFKYVSGKSKKQSARAKSRWNKDKDESRGNAAPHQSGNAPTPTPTPTPTPQEERVTNVTPLVPEDVKAAFNAYNIMAHRIGLPQAQALTDRRKQGIRARLQDAGGLDGWAVALAKIEASPLCRGEKTSWKADLDFMLQQKSFVKLMEGSYDGKTTANHSAPATTLDGKFDRLRADAARRAAAARGRGGEQDRGVVPLHGEGVGGLPFGDE